MKSLHRLSLAEQSAEHLRERLRAGHWAGKLPGVIPLSAELHVSQATLRGALRILEAEGLLTSGGLGRNRTVVSSGKGIGNRRALRVGILLHDARPVGYPKTSQLIPSPVSLAIQHALEAAGHAVFFSRKSQVELQHNVARVGRLVSEANADAWVVVSGSRQVLEWFAEQAVPSIALYGRSGGLPLARTGPDKTSALLAATRWLIGHGHRRIVLIARSPRRKPTPGSVERAFLAELGMHGIPTGDFNLPDWEETPEGFAVLLATLFRHTPPTALIIEETARFIAATQFLARRHIEVPEQVSLVCTDYDSSLAWCHPAVAHMRWNPTPIVGRVVRWVAAVRRGHADRKTLNFPAEFVPGGSIGPARKD